MIVLLDGWINGRKNGRLDIEKFYTNDDELNYKFIPVYSKIF